MKRKSFLVTVYSHEKEIVLNHDTEDESDFTLCNAIKETLTNLNPSAEVFDVAIDTDLDRIIRIATNNDKENKK